MDEEMRELDALEGVVSKSAEVQTQDVTEEDLRKINKFALSPLSADEVFTFKVVAGDNELDDRNFEPFNLNALKDLKKLYIGKPVIKDHRRTADNQVARIYDSELIAEPKNTQGGEAFTKLILKCYMVKTESNADLIKEIKAGIKKEVSTGMLPKKAICSICGVDNVKSYCAHWNGKEYDTPEGKKTCYFTLDGAKEAYELSLVAVPAQPRAGATKHYGGTPTKEAEPPVETEPTTHESQDSDDLTLRVKSIESFIYAQKQEEEN